MGEKMTYETIFARSFSRSDQKKLGYGAFLGCLIILFSFSLVLKPYSTPPLVVSRPIERRTNIVCNSEKRSDFCEINGDITIDAKSSTVFISTISNPHETILEDRNNSSWIIRPYSRKDDQNAMRSVRKWSVKTHNNGTIPECNQIHSVPAILFSLGGYSGNNYHDFTDIIVPLFSTARVFDGEVKLLVTDRNPWWVKKFGKLLQKLSNYDVIEIDNEDNILCFRTLFVGLKRSHKELSIDPSKSPYSMTEFKQFLRNAYSLNKTTAINMSDYDDYKSSNGSSMWQEGLQSPLPNVRTRPRLLILSRNRTRAFTNTDDISKMATSVGFEVVVGEANSDISRFAETVNSCDVMLGVHGAGLTNMVYLPENAILIQITPFGVADWLVGDAFKVPSEDMNIRYLDYKIQKEESSLIEQYPADHEVLMNPFSVFKKGWIAFKTVYLDKQNVKIDVNRFRPTLLRALELLHH